MKIEFIIVLLIIMFAFSCRTNNGKQSETFSVEQINAFYTHLSHTPFVTPYAAYNSLDDFAEFLTFYHLTQHLGCHYTINIQQNNKILNSYEPIKFPEVQKKFPGPSPTMKHILSLKRHYK